MPDDLVLSPFIVGVPRSGTTLLRFMIDSHPSVAIPPETGFVAALAERHRIAPAPSPTPSEFVDLVTHYPADAPVWPDFSMPKDALRRRCDALPSFTVADGLRCFYQLYAAQQGKPRWGDKTPTCGPHIAAVQALLPEARFVHLIRDGRDVACSLRTLWFAPSTDVGDLARHWRDQILATRRAALGVTGYVEVRYEDLLKAPEAYLQRICALVDLPYDAQMLQYHARAPGRLQEHGARRGRDGSIVVSHEQRRRQQHCTTLPLSSDRVGAWRHELAEADVAAFHDAAGDLLRELGYTVPPAKDAGASPASY